MIDDTAYLNFFYGRALKGLGLGLKILALTASLDLT